MHANVNVLKLSLRRVMQLQWPCTHSRLPGDRDSCRSAEAVLAFWWQQTSQC